MAIPELSALQILTASFYSSYSSFVDGKLGAQGGHLITDSLTSRKWETGLEPSH